MSAHPLDPYQTVVKQFANTTLADEDLARFSDRSEIRFAAVVTDVTLKNSPKGRRAFLQVEDKDGSADVNVFGEKLNDFRDMLEPGTTVFFECDLMVDAEGMRRMFVKTMLPVRQIESNLGAAFHIALGLDQLEGGASERLSTVMRRFPGPLPVTIHVKDGTDREALVRLPKIFSVAPDDRLRHEIAQLFGNRAVTYVEAAAH